MVDEIARLYFVWMCVYVFLCTCIKMCVYGHVHFSQIMYGTFFNFICTCIFCQSFFFRQGIKSWKQFLLSFWTKYIKLNRAIFEEGKLFGQNSAKQSKKSEHEFVKQKFTTSANNSNSTIITGNTTNTVKQAVIFLRR